VHRDLKPENLLLKSKDDDTNVKLADFGISRFFDDTARCATVCGTPGRWWWWWWWWWWCYCVCVCVCVLMSSQTLPSLQYSPLCLIFSHIPRACQATLHLKSWTSARKAMVLVWTCGRSVSYPSSCCLVSRLSVRNRWL
jgi:Protein kinase domain